MTPSEVFEGAIANLGKAIVAVLVESECCAGDLTSLFGGHPVGYQLRYVRPATPRSWKRQLQFLEKNGLPLTDEMKHPDRRVWEFWELEKVQNGTSATGGGK